jgi:hypothetical protein
MFASPMAINVTSYKLVYWSYNGTSETNITGYWTTPLVGPEGGAIHSNNMEIRSHYCYY